MIIAQTSFAQTPTETKGHQETGSQQQPVYIIFGVYCGECLGHCATMYSYNMKSDSNQLFVDTTDSFFKLNGRIICKTPIQDPTKLLIVNKLVQQIPNTFLDTDVREQKLGCPDCTDGCGIYFELGQKNISKKFYIDLHSKHLTKEVSAFCDRIKETLNLLYQ
ncbi:hypothetical protein [Phnomibacter ginsenosidimutans]|uniref:Uncharacterized protein n=1 Tax=Phnomibacter ginsenosidimutans TaxID=2676868 RepID=A0A6I6GQK3_9BACT|nr:hypothetical protein [Phnomibacter ginsenosidimutans]QGW29212.1 hypothetical protein GLV81_14820 [Phnomibacter ginsenosidimutans]